MHVLYWDLSEMKGPKGHYVGYFAGPESADGQDCALVLI